MKTMKTRGQGLGAEARARLTAHSDPSARPTLDIAIVAGSEDADAPRVAAHLAVLHEAASHVGLEVDLDLLAAVRTGDLELIVI